MNRRVSSDPWRIEANSSSGVTQLTSFISESRTAADMEDRKFQIMQLAAT